MTATGESYTFGLNQYGQLGTGSVKKSKGAEDQALTPQLVRKDGAANTACSSICACLVCSAPDVVVSRSCACLLRAWQLRSCVLRLNGSGTLALNCAAAHCHSVQALVSKATKVGCGVDFTVWLCDGKVSAPSLPTLCDVVAMRHCGPYIQRVLQSVVSQGNTFRSTSRPAVGAAALFSGSLLQLLSCQGGCTSAQQAVTASVVPVLSCQVWTAGCPQYGQLGHGTDNSYNAGARAGLGCFAGCTPHLCRCCTCDVWAPQHAAHFGTAPCRNPPHCPAPFF